MVSLVEKQALNSHRGHLVSFQGGVREHSLSSPSRSSRAGGGGGAGFHHRPQR